MMHFVIRLMILKALIIVQSPGGFAPLLNFAPILLILHQN